MLKPSMSCSWKLAAASPPHPDPAGVIAAAAGQALGERHDRALARAALEHGERLDALVVAHALGVGRQLEIAGGRRTSPSRTGKRPMRCRRSKPISSVPRCKRAIEQRDGFRVLLALVLERLAAAAEQGPEPGAREAGRPAAVVGDVRPSSSCPRRRPPAGSCRRRPSPGPTSRRNSRDGELSTSPPRNSSWPKRLTSGRPRSKCGIGRARSRRLSSSSGGGGSLSSARAQVAGERRARAGEQAAQHRPAIDSARSGPVSHDGLRSLAAGASARARRRSVDTHCSLRRAEGLGARGGGVGRALLEQLDQLVGHGAGELGGVGDGDGAAVVARHVVADADGDQLDRGARLDLLDHLAQMPLQIAAGVHRQRRSRRPARRPRSSSGCAAAPAAPAGGGAPRPAPRRRCSP